MQNRALLGALLLVLPLLLRCGDSEDKEEGISVSRKITAEGGTISLGDMQASFPAGAVDEETEITIHGTEKPPPAGYVSFSKLFRFEPEGLTFAEPITVELSFTGADNVSVFWTKLGSSDEYENIGGTIDGERISVFVSHFSNAFVGKQSGNDAGVVDSA